MRFLGIGRSNDLAAMYHALVREGHEVRVDVADAAWHPVHAGLLERVPDWERALGWVREAGRDGVILFETAEHGPVQDQLRHEGFQVVGGSGLGDRLEADRGFGQRVLRQAGLRVAPCERFTGYQDGIDWLLRHPQRCVLKFNDANADRTRNYVGQRDDGSDVRALLQACAARAAQPGTAEAAAPVDYVLQQHLQGIEVGVGAYFNGQHFLQPVCVDFEHKRFFPGDLGELTGEMGTLVTYRGGQRLFQAVMAPLAPLLRGSGYCGYLNVNLIANADGLWPLEFTSRFGYPGFAICGALHQEPWSAVLRRLVHQSGLRLATAAGFACGIVLTVPPFPYPGLGPPCRGLPVLVDPPLSRHEAARMAWAEVESQQGQLLTSGPSGYVGVALGVGGDVAQAREQALALAQRVRVPQLRYRHDIGARQQAGELAQLARWGWWQPGGSA